MMQKDGVWKWHEWKFFNFDPANDVKEAMEKQIKAERERRARVITAEGELQASYKIKEASDVLSSSATGMHLRNLQTLNTIANEKSNTIIFPLPTELANLLSAVIPNDSNKKKGSD